MLRRLLLVGLGSLALAAPASAFTKEDGVQTMDDGVSVAYTLYTPDGAAPAGGWPGVAVLHGLGGTRGDMELVSSSFARAGYAVLAYDARGHGTSEGVVTLAGPREVADLRTVRNAFAGRANVSDTKIGAWGISYGGGQIWNALAAGVPFAAAEVVETWTSLYDALWPQDLARSGIVAGLASQVAVRSPLITSLRDVAVQSSNPDAIRQLTTERSALAKTGSIRTPMYLFQGRTDFVFDISQATRAYARLTGPKRLYVGTFGHTPSTFPGQDIGFVLSEGRAWFDAHLKDVGADLAPQVTIGSLNGKKTKFSGLPKTTSQTFTLAGRSVLKGGAIATRQTAALGAPLESWGGGTATVTVPKLANYPRLVVTVLAGPKIVAQGGLKPKAGVNRVTLANYCVYVPRGARLRVSVGAASPAGQFAYLGFPGSGSATIGPITLKLSTLAKPVSG